MQGKSNGKYPFCKVSDVSWAVAENGGLLDEAANFVGDEELLQLRAKSIPTGATVFAKIGEGLRLNRRAYVQRECIIDNNVAGLKAIDGIADDYFVFLLSQLIDLNNYCGGAVPSVNKSTLEAIEIVVPSYAEQLKIADCLLSLDELIAAQGRKVEALKTYKRGLMQQLFPREGETLPRLRFPEFRDAPEWEEVKAGTLFANRSERGHDSLPIYSVTMTEGLVRRSSLDRRIDDLAEASGNKKVHRHDIAYNMMRMWQGACGVASEECMVSPAYVVLSPQPGVHSPFYGYFFKLPHMLRVLTSHSRGLTEDRLRLYYLDFSRIPLPQPDVREQARIADCLSAVDAQVSIEAENLQVLKTHKHGLMQQMFPPPSEA